MRPPYDPAHRESVSFGKKPHRLGGLVPDPSTVIARCSCGVDGQPHPLGIEGTAAALAADFNAHRDTYVQAVPA